MIKALNTIAIIIAVAMVCFGLIIDFNPKISMSGAEKIVIYVIPMIILFMNMILQIKKENEPDKKEKIKKQTLLFIFIIYLISLGTLLFLGSEYRQIDNTNPFSLEAIQARVNLIPFKTIVTLTGCFLKGIVNLNVILINIGGNLLAFAPFGFFIPILFSNKVKNKKQFTLFMIAIVFIVELMQFLTNTGVADIDDIILNTTGALIVYCITQTKFIKNLFIFHAAK
jgi:glycopeptide antibiotics resistance protein